MDRRRRDSFIDPYSETSEELPSPHSISMYSPTQSRDDGTPFKARGGSSPRYIRSPTRGIGRTVRSAFTPVNFCFFVAGILCHAGFQAINPWHMTCPGYHQAVPLGGRLDQISGLFLADPDAPVAAQSGKPVVEDDGSEVHYAAGKHLLVDLYRADSAMLNDREGLEEAVVSIIRNAGMHLLSVAAHKLDPQGVTVVAGISESHLTIHTWPEHGTALIDLFTCGDGADLISVLPDMVAKFGGDVKNARWSMVPRGARGYDDTFKYILSRQHVGKKRVAKATSEYQKIDIWNITEVEELSYDKQSTRTSSQKPPAASVLFLDGVLQSSTADEHVYHESLVHPAMTALDHSPKRVAILGGGEGATLREVLKYKTVEEAVMVELDGEVVKQCREHMPSMSNCTWTGAGDSTFKSCFDDPRAKLVLDDASKWFRERFGANACSEVDSSKKFDVIILDLLDPELLPEFDFAKMLYSPAFFKELGCALHDDGVLVAQLGEAPAAGDIEQALMIKNEVMDNLAAEFVPGGLNLYDVYVPSFQGEWSFAVGCKNRACANRWYSTPAEVDATLASRLDPASQRTKNFGELQYFDGSVAQKMQSIPRGWQDLFCEPEVEGGPIPRESCKLLKRDLSDLAKVPAAAGDLLQISRESVLAMAREAVASGSEKLKQTVGALVKNGITCDSSGGKIYIKPNALVGGCADQAAWSGGSTAAAVKLAKGSIPRWDPVVMRHPEERCFAAAAASGESSDANSFWGSEFGPSISAWAQSACAN